MSTVNVVTQLVARPRYEGANIRSWIGFKHLMYIVEEAVLQWFRENGFGPQRLFHEFGLGLEIIDSSALLPAVVEIDDELVAETTPQHDGRLAVKLYARRDGSDVVVLRGKVEVALIREQAVEDAPPLELAHFIRASAAATAARDGCGDRRLAPGETAHAALSPPDSSAFLWLWLARYFHCHFSDRVQHSAYIRALEEVVDRYLSYRGLAIGRILRERGWIPVVSRARIQILADAHMEETIHTTFVVEDVIKRLAYDARMDCYVQRGDQLVHVATAKILHGYAWSRGEEAGTMVELDEATIQALTGGGGR